MRLFIFNVVIWNFVAHYVSVCTGECRGDLIASTQYGKVKGKKVMGSEGDEFCSFRGIPYAKPPIGELRFRDPEPPEPWQSIREATAYGPPCAQHTWFTNQMLGEEDCLHLNVFTKSTDAEIKRPVMVWIHGGGFATDSGDSDFYGPDYFMRKDIVLVTINYRLGILGFLNLNHEVAAGNQGMKDQVLALQWVRDNIVNFGGDPNSVTIFGESAGSAAVHLLTLSPLSRGLYHKAIMQSGSVFNQYAFTDKSEELAIEILHKLNYTGRNPESSVAYLRTLDIEKILETRNEMFTKEKQMSLDYGFIPCVDSKSKNPFMPVDPEILAAEGIQVPLIIGFTSREGIVFAKHISELGDRISEDYPKLIHPDTVDVFKKKYDMTIDSLRHMYFGYELVTQDNNDKMVDLLGDIFINIGIHKAVEIQTKKGRLPTYFYQFSYDAGLTPSKILYEGTQFRGAAHADDMSFQFKHEAMVDIIKFLEKGTVNYRVMEQMVEMWVNFATTGNPTPTPSSELLPFQWLPLNNDTVFSCLNICEDPRMENVSNVEEKFA